MGEVNAMKYKAALGLMLLALIPGTAQASDTYSGKITVLQVNDTGTMHFRVALNATMTNCDLNFAFVEKSSTVYDTIVATMTTAYNLGKTVTLQVNRETNGYCRIFFVSY
ncbi:MAG: hypothetical protein V4610_19710 [Pseudomonadota bacterium]